MGVAGLDTGEVKDFSRATHRRGIGCSSAAYRSGKAVAGLHADAVLGVAGLHTGVVQGCSEAAHR